MCMGFTIYWIVSTVISLIACRFAFKFIYKMEGDYVFGQSIAIPIVAFVFSFIPILNHAVPITLPIIILIHLRDEYGGDYIVKKMFFIKTDKD